MSPVTEHDKQDILQHITSIFQAYIARDRDTIKRLHTDDWVGFQGPSVQIERGIVAYMRNADKSLEAFCGIGFELLDTEIQIFGDIAIVYYIARYDYRNSEGVVGSVPLRSVDIYRRFATGWNQIGSHICPVPTTGKWGEGEE